MGNSGVYVTGLRATVLSMQKMGVEVSDLKAAFRKVADLVTGEAKSIVPVKTGRLQASIRPGTAKNKAVVRAGGAKVPYAGPQNYGWAKKNITAKGFLTKPANSNTEKYAAIIDTELHSLIYKLGLNK